LARLAARLRGMPSPEFKSRLAAELFPQTSQPFFGRIPLLNRIPKVMSRRLAAAGAAVAIAALAIAAVAINPFSSSRSSAAGAFGTLRGPREPVPAAIEGGTGAITWQLEDGAVLPDSAPAYRLSMAPITAGRAAELAHSLGVEGPVVTLDDRDGRGGNDV